MPGAAEDIILTIALSGQDDVVARLGEIGEAGVGAMAKLESAVEGGSAVFAGLTAAIAGVGAGLFYWANSTAETVQHMSDLAGASGTTISQISGLTQTLSAAGAETGTLGSAFRRLSFTIEAEWQRIIQESRKSANELAEADIKVKESTLSVADAREKAFQANQKLQETQQSVGMGGNPITDPTILNAHKLADAHREAQRAQLEYQKAVLEAADTQDAATERQRNDINTVKDAVDSIAKGQQTFGEASKNANLTYENVIKGIVASSGQAGQALKDFNGNISDLIGKEPTVMEAFKQFADFLKNSGNDALNTALAYRLLGRGVGQDVVEALKLGSTGLQDYIDHLEKLGLVLTDTDKKAAKDFTQSFHLLSGELETTIHQLGSFVEPIFTQGFDNLRASVEQNHKAILQWGQDMAEKVRPIILDFFEAISGQDPSHGSFIKPLKDGLEQIIGFIKSEVVPAFKGLVDALTGSGAPQGSTEEVWKNRFEAIGHALKDVAGVAKEVFQDIYAVADKVAKVFDSIFGTKLDGADVIAIAIGAKLTGAFGALEKAITGASGAFGKFLGLLKGGAEAGGTAGGLEKLIGTGIAGPLGAAAAGGATIAGVGSADVAKDTVSAVIYQIIGKAAGSSALIAAGALAVGALLETIIEDAVDKAKKHQKEVELGHERPDQPLGAGSLESDPLGTGIKTDQQLEEERVRRLTAQSTDAAGQYKKLTPAEQRARDYYLSQTASEQDAIIQAGGGVIPPGPRAPVRPVETRPLNEIEQPSAPQGPGHWVTPPADPNRIPREVFGADIPDKVREGAKQGTREGVVEGSKAQKPATAVDQLDQLLNRERDLHLDSRTGQPPAPQQQGDTVTFPGGSKAIIQDLTQLGTDIQSGGQQTKQAIDQVGADVHQGGGQLVGALTSIASQIASIQIQQPGSTATGADGGLVQVFATGGPAQGVISGPGGPKDDLIPAMLSNEEFVVRADGSNLHDAISYYKGKGRFAEGGLIEALHLAEGGSPFLGGGTVSETFTVSGHGYHKPPKGAGIYPALTHLVGGIGLADGGPIDPKHRFLRVPDADIAQFSPAHFDIGGPVAYAPPQGTLIGNETPVAPPISLSPGDIAETFSSIFSSLGGSPGTTIGQVPGNAPGSPGSMQNFGTVDLRTNFGDFPVAISQPVLTSLSAEAVRAAVKRGQVMQTWRR